MKTNWTREGTIMRETMDADLFSDGGDQRKVEIRAEDGRLLAKRFFRHGHTYLLAVRWAQAELEKQSAPR